MAAKRRSVAAVMAFLVLQLALLGAVSPCMHAGGSSDPTGAPQQQSHHADSDCGDSADSSEQTQGAGDSCLAMLSCSVPMLQLGSATADAARTVVADPVERVLAVLATRATAPELPPPRA